MSLGAQVSFDEFRRFAVLLPERQLAKERILATWIDSADWMEGVEYRCGQRLSLHPSMEFKAFCMPMECGLLSPATPAC